MVADEEDPRAVLRLPARPHPVAICRTVLGHIDRDIAVVVAEIDKLLVKPVGFDRPAHVGVFGPLRRRPEIGAEQPARIDHLMHAAIVVEAQEIDRLANRLHVPRLDQRLEVGDQAVGIPALEQRVQARPVPHRIPLRGGVPVGLVARRRLGRLNAEHGAQLPVLRPHRPKRRKRPPLGQILVVDRGAIIGAPPQVGRMAARCRGRRSRRPRARSASPSSSPGRPTARRRSARNRRTSRRCRDCPSRRDPEAPAAGPSDTGRAKARCRDGAAHRPDGRRNPAPWHSPAPSRPAECAATRRKTGKPSTRHRPSARRLPDSGCSGRPRHRRYRC